jgi:hypothetical protein
VLLGGLAIAVRAVPAGRAVLEGNETFSWRLAVLPWGELVRRTAADVHPPLYYLLLKAWIGAAGDSVLALRAPSVLLGALAVVALFQATQAWGRFGGPAAGTARIDRAGLLAALLLTFNPLAVEWSAKARMYALGTALSAAALAALGKALGDPERSGRAWLAFLVASAASLYAHNFALFTVAAELAVAAGWIVLRLRDQNQRPIAARELKRLGLVALGIGLAYAPWVGVLAWQVQDVAADYWIQRSPEMLDFLVDLSVWAAGARDLRSAERLAWSLLPVGLLIVALLRKDAAALALLAIALGPWAGWLAAERIVGRPLFQLRYLSFAQVAWMAFLGLGTARLPHRIARWTVAVALVATAASGFWDWTEQALRRSAGTPVLIQAVEELREHIRPADLIVVKTAADVNRVRYYALHAGIRNPVVTTTARRGKRPGQVVQLAALGPGDFLTDHDPRHPPDRRLWAAVFGVGAPGNLPDGFESTAAPLIRRDAAGETVQLYLYSPSGGDDQQHGQQRRHQGAEDA